ncbi:hypothetical protein M2419_005641 [Sphingobacterium sp. BIGb0116]|nr:hypothetical protein [Sphingobacterium sp. BIGb0116]
MNLLMKKPWAGNPRLSTILTYFMKSNTKTVITDFSFPLIFFDSRDTVKSTFRVKQANIF